MTYYITNGKTPAIDLKEYETIEEAFESARAPAWAGAKSTEIMVTGDTSYTYRGERYQIIEGRNPRALKAEVLAKKPQDVTSSRSVYNTAGKFSSYRLSREMDRADSDF